MEPATINSHAPHGDLYKSEVKKQTVKCDFGTVERIIGATAVSAGLTVAIVILRAIVLFSNEETRRCERMYEAPGLEEGKIVITDARRHYFCTTGNVGGWFVGILWSVPLGAIVSLIFYEILECCISPPKKNKD
ncbi:MAG: hypothetical protein K940chlam3_01078 [Chlamydiae bacterium]|nr:hypothetical protein [Chlamydiota bacterium]